ncbi:MAG TPA: HK97 family phage prohead protease, partial [Candidatus Kurthia intestinigallinarum]|nr:HK97 family phage prohead protease [Candidatus Kurthia intestinigallinarum]
MEATEKRNLTTNQVEIREDEGGQRVLTGYAVKWEMKSVPMGYFQRFKEQFKRGAFTESLTNDDQKALWSHDTSKVLGRTKNGTLRL